MAALQSLVQADSPELTPLAAAQRIEPSIGAGGNTRCPRGDRAGDAYRSRRSHEGPARPDPGVRKAAASFREVPADEPTVLALAAALADSNEEVRLSAAQSLSEIMFENPRVLPTLVKALGKDPERQSVLQALDQYLEKRPAEADLARVRRDLRRLQSTLVQATPSPA